MLPNLTIALFFIGLFYLIAGIAYNVSRRGLSRVSRNAAANDLLSTILRFFILLIGLFVSLGVLQLDKAVTSLLAGAGVVGLIIGFAFQEIASNFIAGVIIAFHQPFRVGDTVKVMDYLGRISAITLRTTTITSLQGLDIIMPNKDMFTNPVLNYTHTPIRRIDLDVGISYGESLPNVQEVVCKALAGLDGRLESRDIEFFYTGFGDSSINFQVRIWVKDPEEIFWFKTRHEAILRIKRAFDENDIVIPFPIRTLDFGIKGGTPLKDNLKDYARLAARSGAAAEE